MEIGEKIEKAFKDLLTSLQTAKLYGAEHPITKNSIEKTYFSLQAVLSERKDLVVGIIGEELAFEKEIFFDLSKVLKQMIVYLKEREIERISFGRDLEKEELYKFIGFLTRPKEETKGRAADLLALAGIRNIAIGKVRSSSAVAGSGPEQQPLDLTAVYQESLEEVSLPLAKIMNREAIDGLSLKLTLNNIIENLGIYYQQLLKLVTLKRYDLGTFTHLLNVSILSIYFSSKLGFSKDVVMDIGLAALFHDIGKLYISRKTIRKPGALSDSEFAQMESHTILGAKLLMQYVETIGIMPVVVSFEHHLRYDLSGYPRFPYKNKQHIASAIVSICDVYDALSQRRTYKTDYPSDMIYNLMLRGSGTTFEPGLLDIFFKAIGVWPRGTLVALSDERVAVVIDENEDDIFLPVVRVIHPQGQEEVINLREDKEIKIDRYLSPWTEGKEFLHLI
ncbi:MAG: HD domain-containing protein [Candidatus Omnitrophica bacterium]|nr:HD domain-containing protein [Candidatus Omnitrophota bacterium]MDD5027057.1 HD domain-containing protein [Candidatus Omnitrophota bacterium]MDD5662141.1 HD domain-containing protein [Candidatus Omnitrophota bacterium]